MEHNQITELKHARNTKDRVFRLLFREKEELLSLYNAVNNTSYDNPDDLTVTTLENAIYITMKNDLSFLLYDNMMLYEHQSTDNPNIPLRDLFYVSSLYSGLVPPEKLYSSSRQLIPEPKFIVFYNGTARLPERFEYTLLNISSSISKSCPIYMKLETSQKHKATANPSVPTRTALHIRFRIWN